MGREGRKEKGVFLEPGALWEKAERKELGRDHHHAFLCGDPSSSCELGNVTVHTKLLTSICVSSEKVKKVAFSPVFHNWQHRNNVERKHR